jgi:hypothetical protein
MCQKFYVISKVFRPWKDRRGDESDCHGEVLKINIRLPDQNCCPNEAQRKRSVIEDSETVLYCQTLLETEMSRPSNRDALVA